MPPLRLPDRSVNPWHPAAVCTARLPGGKRVKNRLHPDVAPYRGDDPGAEIARLRNEGAALADVGQGADVSWTVLADPESNEFCVLSPR